MKKILLIDDHPEDNSNFISLLRNAYAVDVSAYLSTAIIKLSNGMRYDLVVLDVMMPDVGIDFKGIDTEDGLRTGLAFYEAKLKDMNIPVLFWSWNQDFEQEIKEKKWDKTDFLYKETEDDHLLNGVERFINKMKL